MADDEAKAAKAKAEEEKRKQEAEEAKQQLNDMLKQTAPKNLGQGLTTGVGNILGAAVGAAGIIVLVPTVGLAAGVKHGGLLGGIVGLTGGAVIGVLGGAALAIGGEDSCIVWVFWCECAHLVRNSCIFN